MKLLITFFAFYCFPLYASVVFRRTNARPQQFGLPVVPMLPTSGFPANGIPLGLNSPNIGPPIGTGSGYLVAVPAPPYGFDYLCYQPLKINETFLIAPP